MNFRHRVRWQSAEKRPRNLRPSPGQLPPPDKLCNFNPAVMELLTSFFFNLSGREQQRHAARFADLLIANDRARRRRSIAVRQEDNASPQIVVRDWKSMGPTSAPYRRSFSSFLRFGARPFVM